MGSKICSSLLSLRSLAGFSLLLAFSVFTVLLNGSSVNAATQFDGTVQITDRLEVVSDNGQHSQDVTNQIADLVQNYCSVPIRDSFTAHINSTYSGRVAITEERLGYTDQGGYYNPGGTSVMVTWFNQASDWYGQFIQDDQGVGMNYLRLRPTIPGNQLNPGGGYIGVGIDNSGNLQVYCHVTYDGYQAISNNLPEPELSHPIPSMPNYTESRPSVKVYYAYNFDIEYPAGYEGLIVPEAGTIPPDVITITPDIEVMSGNNRVFRAIDNNYYTFDNPPFLCSGEFAPLLHYEIFRGQDPDTDELVHSGVMSATGILERILDENTYFTLVTYYDCSGDPLTEGSTFTYFNTGDTEESDLQPDLNIISGINFNITIQDRNFNTFDPVPFTCQNGLTPVMGFNLTDKSTQSSVEIGVMSPTVQFVRDLNREEKEYIFYAWYDCGDFPETQFANVSVIEFGFNSFGGITRECSNGFDGLFCRINDFFSFGIFSTTLNGLTSVFGTFTAISPQSCTTSWVQYANFTNDILPVQNMPTEVCQFAEAHYKTPDTPFYTITQWVNVLLSGAAVLLLVFGLMALFGINVRVSSPIGEETDTGIRPDIATSSSISKHRGTYSASPAGTKDVTFNLGSHDPRKRRY